MEKLDVNVGVFYLKSGYIHFSTGVQMSLDGLEIKVKCTCGKITQVKIKNTIECAD